MNGIESVQIATAAGGSCGNVLTILSYFGWDSYPFTRLGKGSMVDIVLDDLKRWNVNTNHLIRTNTNSVPVVIEKIDLTKNPPTHSFSFKCPCCGNFLPRFQPITLKQYSELLPNISKIPNIFYFDRITPSILKMVENFASNGTLIFFEPQVIKDSKEMRKAIKLSNILKYSNQRNDEDIDIKDIIKLNSIPELEIITLGQNGLKYRRNESNWNYINSYPIINIKDTAGAGDWCTAGIINHLARNSLKSFQNCDDKDIEYGLKYGQALSAINCSFFGARGVMYHIKLNDLNSYVLQMIESHQESYFLLKNDILQKFTQKTINIDDIIIDEENLCKFLTQ